MPFPFGQPYLIYGLVTSSSGAGLENISVSATNIRTSDIQYINTNISGQFIFDANNFNNTYVNGDSVTVTREGYSSRTITINTDNYGSECNLYPTGYGFDIIVYHYR